MASGSAREPPGGRECETGGQEKICALPPPTASRSRQQPLRLALVALLDEVVDQFARGVVHLHVERFDTTGEIVEGHDCRDSHQKAKGRGNQGLRDAARDRADARGLLRRDLLEGVQDADDRAEQANERGRGADGGKDRKAPLQLGVNDGLSPLQRAL